MRSFSPSELPTAKLHGILLGSIGPRPIAFASTVDRDENPNLSPFSFFNVFSARPPILIFSPARRGRDNTTKHTLENILETKEVVINIVNYDMVHQMSLASTEYPKGVNEFEKSGFTMLKSDLVTPFRVKESPVQFECKVNDVVALGNEGGAGNLVICEVLRIHVREDLINEELRIDQTRIDTVARMGGDWYARAFGAALFEVPKPLQSIGIGVNSLPADIRNSLILSGNDLGQLGNVESLPDETEVNEYRLTELAELFVSLQDDPILLEKELHQRAKLHISNGDARKALLTLLSFNN